MGPEQLLREIGLWFRKRALEVAECFPLSPVKAGLDVDPKYIPAPSMFNGRLRIPETLFFALDLVQDDAVVKPWQLSSNLLDNCLLGPSL